MREKISSLRLCGESSQLKLPVMAAFRQPTPAPDRLDVGDEAARFHQARQIGFRKLTILLMGNGADQAVVAAVRNGKQIA